MVSADADVSTNSGPTMTFLFTEFANCTARHPKGTPRYSTAPYGDLGMGPVGLPVPCGTVLGYVRQKIPGAGQSRFSAGLRN